MKKSQLFEFHLFTWRKIKISQCFVISNDSNLYKPISNAGQDCKKSQHNMLSTQNMKNYEGYCSHLPSKLCAKCSLFGQSLSGDNHRTEAIYLQINERSKICIPPKNGECRRFLDILLYLYLSRWRFS